MVVLASESTKCRTCVVHYSFLLLFHSVAIREGKEIFPLLHKTKEKLKEMAQNHAQPFVDVVVQLLQRPFGSRSIADQKLTVQQPRPMPTLKIKTGDRSFQLEWYSKKDWLCGSIIIGNGLFCWPCLLFKPGVSQSWTERGYTNLRNVLSDGKKHEKSTAHLEAYKMWKTYDVSERVDVMFSRARREEIERHNDEVRQNRGILRTLSEAVLYLSSQELPFRGHDESSNSLNRGKL